MCISVELGTFLAASVHVCACGLYMYMCVCDTRSSNIHVTMHVLAMYMQLWHVYTNTQLHEMCKTTGVLVYVHVPWVIHG